MRELRPTLPYPVFGYHPTAGREGPQLPGLLSGKTTVLYQYDRITRSTPDILNSVCTQALAVSTIVKATVPTGGFALQDTFEETPGATVKTLGVAAHTSSQPMPFLWATAPDLEAVDSAIRSDVTVQSVRAVSCTDGHQLYELSWEPRVRSLLRVLVESGGTLLDACAHKRRWEFDLFFPTHAAASRTYDCCLDWGIDLTVSQLKNNPTSVGDPDRFLSAKQHETLVTAYETDYYSVPRGVTMEELARHLNVSHQALSERLRRGHQGLISKTLTDDPDTVKLL